MAEQFSVFCVLGLQWRLEQFSNRFELEFYYRKSTKFFPRAHLSTSEHHKFLSSNLNFTWKFSALCSVNSQGKCSRWSNFSGLKQIEFRSHFCNELLFSFARDFMTHEKFILTRNARLSARLFGCLWKWKSFLIFLVFITQATDDDRSFTGWYWSS